MIPSYAFCRVCTASSARQGVGLSHAQRVCRGRQPCVVRLGKGCRGDAPTCWSGFQSGPGHRQQAARSAGEWFF